MHIVDDKSLIQWYLKFLKSLIWINKCIICSSGLSESILSENTSVALDFNIHHTFTSFLLSSKYDWNEASSCVKRLSRKLCYKKIDFCAALTLNLAWYHDVCLYCKSLYLQNYLNFKMMTRPCVFVVIIILHFL